MVSRPQVPGDAAWVPHSSAARRLEIEPVVWRMVIDVMTADLCDAFGVEGIRCILLKGPAIARWLYLRPAERSYLDVDLLVPEAQLARAERLLERKGFKRLGREAIPGDWPKHAHNWIRPDGAVLDLHYTIPGAGVPPSDVWDVLRGRVETMIVANRSVDVLDEGARALLVALHAWKDGRVRQARADLALALDRLPRGAWEDAAGLADSLQALEGMAAGLEREPAGRSLARDLHLPTERSTAVALRAEGAPPLAVGIDWFIRTPGWREKTALVIRKVFPPPAFLRDWSPLAERGPIGLAAAYVWRPLWILWHAGPALRAWFRAKRGSGRASGSR